jgi:hypothetical protein
MAAAPDDEDMPTTEAAALKMLKLDSPVGLFLRDYMATQSCTITEALASLRVSKPTLRSYKLAFRTIVRFWYDMQENLQLDIAEWDAAWEDSNDDRIYPAMVAAVKTHFYDLTEVLRAYGLPHLTQLSMLICLLRFREMFHVSLSGLWHMLRMLLAHRRQEEYQHLTTRRLHYLTILEQSWTTLTIMS